MRFDYSSDVTPGPIVTRLVDAMRESRARVDRVIRMYQTGILDTIADALGSPWLKTDAEREQVREAITPVE